MARCRLRCCGRGSLVAAAPVRDAPPSEDLPVPVPPPPLTWTLPADGAISVEGAWVPQSPAAWPTWYRVDGSQLGADGNGWVLTVAWQTRQQNPNGTQDLTLPMAVAVDNVAIDNVAIDNVAGGAARESVNHLASFADFGPAERRTSRYRLAPGQRGSLDRLVWGPTTATGMSWGIELAPRCNGFLPAPPSTRGAGQPELSVLRATASGCDWLRWSGSMRAVAHWDGDCAVHLAVHPSGQQAVVSGFAIPWALRGLGQSTVPLLPLPPAQRDPSLGPAAANVAAWDSHGALRAVSYVRQAHATPFTWLDRSSTGWVPRNEPTVELGVKSGCFDPPLQGRLECRLLHRSGWPDTFPAGRVVDECATPLPEPIEPSTLTLLNERFADRRPGLRWLQIGGVLAYAEGNMRGAAPLRFASPALLLLQGALWEIPGSIPHGTLRFVVRGDYALFTHTDGVAAAPRFRLVHLTDGRTVTTLEGGGIQSVQFWPAGAAADRLSGHYPYPHGRAVNEHVGRAHRHKRH